MDEPEPSCGKQVNCGHGPADTPVGFFGLEEGNGPLSALWPVRFLGIVALDSVNPTSLPVTPLFSRAPDSRLSIPALWQPQHVNLEVKSLIFTFPWFANMQQIEMINNIHLPFHLPFGTWQRLCST